jgi:alkylation response protein AidB-like acyl-CoA dehydrogenase
MMTTLETSVQAPRDGARALRQNLRLCDMIRRVFDRQTFVRARNYAAGAGVKGSFDWRDPLNLDAMLSDEERMVRDQAHNYAQTKLLPRVTNAYRNESFDRNIMREMGDLGLLGATIEGNLAR